MEIEEKIMDEQRKAFKLLIPSIILFVVVIFVAIWFGLDVNGRIKKDAAWCMRNACHVASFLF